MGWPRHRFGCLGDAGTRETRGLHRISSATDSESPLSGPRSTTGLNSIASSRERDRPGRVSARIAVSHILRALTLTAR